MTLNKAKIQIGDLSLDEYHLTASGSKVYILAGEYFIKSNNKGTTFELLARYGKCSCITSDSIGNIYFSASVKNEEETIYIYNGTKITPVESAPTGFYKSIVTSGNGNIIYATDTLKRVFAIVPGNIKNEIIAENVLYFDCDNSGDNLVYSTEVGVFRSTDRGKTWELYFQFIGEYSDYRCVITADGKHIVSFATSGETLYYNTDTLYTAMVFYLGSYNISRSDGANNCIISTGPVSYIFDITNKHTTEFLTSNNSNFLISSLSYNGNVTALFDSNYYLTTITIGEDPTDKTELIMGLPIGVFILVLIIMVLVGFLIIIGIYTLTKYMMTLSKIDKLVVIQK